MSISHIVLIANMVQDYLIPARQLELATNNKKSKEKWEIVIY